MCKGESGEREREREVTGVKKSAKQTPFRQKERPSTCPFTPTAPAGMRAPGVVAVVVAVAAAARRRAGWRPAIPPATTALRPLLGHHPLQDPVPVRPVHEEADAPVHKAAGLAPLATLVRVPVKLAYPPEQGPVPGAAEAGSRSGRDLGDRARGWEWGQRLDDAAGGAAAVIIAALLAAMVNGRRCPGG